MFLATVNHCVSLRFQKGTLLSELLKQAGVPFSMPCGGNGICGNCKVIAQGELSSLEEKELSHLTEKEQKEGYRLACCAKATGDVSLFTTDTPMVINTKISPGILSSFSNDCTGLVLDIGTTTVAGVLFQNGTVVHRIAEQNRQCVFGADVITRIQAEKEHTNTLYSLLQEQVKDIFHQCNHPKQAVIVANTVMLHFLLGYPVSPLGEAPYQTEDLFGKTYTIFGTECYIAPCISAFVGADITAGVLASGMTEQSSTAMLVDLGTNGEMVYFDGKTITSASTAVGPAFEGAGIFYGMPAQEGAIDHVFYQDGSITYSTIGNLPAKGFCGSGLVDVLAVMKQCGALEESGTLNSQHPFCRRDHHGKICFALPGSDIIVRGSDVRKLQLAKAAVHAGMLTLANQVDTLYLAGGFGLYLNPENAELIGLFPKHFTKKFCFLGNAALSGGCRLLSSLEAQQKAQEIAAGCVNCELSMNPVFTEHYVDKMAF